MHDKNKAIEIVKYLKFFFLNPNWKKKIIKKNNSTRKRK